MAINPQLVVLYQKMSELTAPVCKTYCRAPQSCCSPEYCEMADERARENGIIIPKTDHPTLPFMGKTGCVMPPHLRPSCTLHSCPIQGYGFKPNDEKWTDKYFKIRNKIDTLEFTDTIQNDPA